MSLVHQEALSYACGMNAWMNEWVRKEWWLEGWPHSSEGETVGFVFGNISSSECPGSISKVQLLTSK